MSQKGTLRPVVTQESLDRERIEQRSEAGFDTHGVIISDPRGFRYTRAMSLAEVLDYVRSPCDPSPGAMTAGEVYGTEHFGIWLYAWLRMERPRSVIELGIGTATTTALAALALHENGEGRLWAIDDGSDWTRVPLQPMCQYARSYEDPGETHMGFVRRLLSDFGLGERVTLVNDRVESSSFFIPEGRKVDVVFADAPPSDAVGCINLLRYYLPRVSGHASLFIDKASTINHSYLLLEWLIEQLDRGRIPAHLIQGLQPSEAEALRQLVDCSAFRLVHLTEADTPSKRNPNQNSRAWIRITPNDFLPHNGVRSLL